VTAATTEARQLVDKLWSYCHVLRHDGVSTIDYVDQLTLLLFLKMAHERAERRLGGREVIVPEHLGWQTLLDADAQELKDVYDNILDQLGKRSGALGRIFHNAQNKIRNAATLKRLIVDLIEKQNWSATKVDIKGDAYEALLEKGAEDVKSGAGQYFTPRALIQTMVECMQPTAQDTIIDPACGTGGFLLAAYEHITKDREGEMLSAEEAQHVAGGGIRGVELVEDTARLAQMNLLLHGIGRASGPELIEVHDSLAQKIEHHATLVLANPPFGRKSGFTTVDEFGRVTRDDDSYERDDFWVTTSNKQLNFVQHIYRLLRVGGRAAVVVPDNVLFEGGAGETIRRRLLDECDVHTLLRLPTGIFYAGGVKANVLFFDKQRARLDKPWTSKLWVYDFRTGQHFTLRQRKLDREHLQDFVDCYLVGKPREERTGTERFKAFSYDELVARDKASLDITWLRDPDAEDSDNLPSPEVIAQEIVEDLQGALNEFAAVADALEAAKGARQEEAT
jgi:type I restriction enzyme M protein